MGLLPVLIVALVVTSKVLPSHCHKPGRRGGRGRDDFGRGSRGFGHWPYGHGHRPHGHGHGPPDLGQGPFDFGQEPHDHGHGTHVHECFAISGMGELSSATGYRRVRQCYSGLAIPEEEELIIGSCADLAENATKSESWFFEKGMVENYIFYDCLINSMNFIDTDNTLNISAIADSYSGWEGDNATLTLISDALDDCIQESAPSNDNNVMDFLEIMHCFGVSCRDSLSSFVEDNSASLDLKCVEDAILKAAETYRDDEIKEIYKDDSFRQYKLFMSILRSTLLEDCGGFNLFAHVLGHKHPMMRPIQFPSRSKREAEISWNLDSGEDLGTLLHRSKRSSSESDSESESDESEETSETSEESSERRNRTRGPRNL